MKSKMLPVLTATVLMLLIAGYGSSFAATPTLPAATECSAIAEGGEGAIPACEQGYKGTRLNAPLVTICLLGVGKVAVHENQLDCKMGYVAAGGVSKAAPSVSSTGKA